MVPVKTNSNWLPSIFNDFFENEWLAKTGVTAPALHVIENEKEEKKDKKYLRREFSYSKFQQTILLPENVEKDKISAKVEHGILSIEIPKVKEEEKQKTSKAIEVK